MVNKKEWIVVHTSGKFIGTFANPNAAKKLIDKKYNGSIAFLIKEKKENARK